MLSSAWWTLINHCIKDQRNHYIVTAILKKRCAFSILTSNQKNTAEISFTLKMYFLRKIKNIIQDYISNVKCPKDFGNLTLTKCFISILQRKMGLIKYQKITKIELHFLDFTSLQGFHNSSLQGFPNSKLWSCIAFPSPKEPLPKRAN